MRIRLAGATAAALLLSAGLSAAAAAESASPSSGAGSRGGESTSQRDDKAALAQTLTWAANNSTTAYAAAPTEAVAGPTTIVFENSAATGNTSGMQHTLTFDTSGGDYNDDVDVDILAFPSDENGGRWQVDVTLTEGTYQFHCNIPGHGQMTGELVVTGGGGGEDTTPPDVSATLDGETDANGDFLGQATATVEATDAGGIASVEYQVDDTGWQPYTAPVVVDEIGDHTIGYRATDTAGNVSTEGNDPFTVVAPTGDDVTPPEVTAMLHGETNADGAYLGSAEVMLSATDSQSEIASIEYRLDDGEWTTYTDMVAVTDFGDHVVQHRATDAAGNVSEPGEVTFTVVQGTQDDTTPPEVSATVAGVQDASWHYLGEVEVSLEASDEGSGVDRVEYLLDDGDWQAYGDPVTVDAEGEHTVKYRAHDEAGNTSEAGLVGFTIVADAPTPRCAAPDPSPVVVMGEVGTTVHNREADGACTIDDLIRDEARWSSHPSFVTHVRSVLEGLLADGIVTGAERSQIVKAATRSDVGRQA